MVLVYRLGLHHPTADFHANPFGRQRQRLQPHARPILHRHRRRLGVVRQTQPRTPALGLGNRRHDRFDRIRLDFGMADPRATLYRTQRHHLVPVARHGVSRHACHDADRLLRRLLLRPALHLAANRQQRILPRPRRRRQQHYQWRVHGIGCHFKRGTLDVVRQHFPALPDRRHRQYPFDCLPNPA